MNHAITFRSEKIFKKNLTLSFYKIAIFRLRIIIGNKSDYQYINVRTNHITRRMQTCGDNKIDIAWYPEPSESSFSFNTHSYAYVATNWHLFVINKLFLNYKSVSFNYIFLLPDCISELQKLVKI